MPPTPVLHTPRLILRPVRSKDAPVIQRRFPRWDVVRWLDAKVPWPYPADGAATFVADCLAEMARGEKSHWAIVPSKGPADLIGLIRPVAGRRHEPRPARLLARSRLPGQGPDDRGGRPGDRLRLRASSAGRMPVAEQCPGEPRLAPHQGEAGRATGRPADRPVRQRRELDRWSGSSTREDWLARQRPEARASRAAIRRRKRPSLASDGLSISERRDAQSAARSSSSVGTGWSSPSAPAARMARSRWAAIAFRRFTTPPVPAGIRRPTMTFSLRPCSVSTLARDGRLGQHARGLLEGGRRDERLGLQRRLGDAEQHRVGLGGLQLLGDRAWRSRARTRRLSICSPIRKVDSPASVISTFCSI